MVDIISEYKERPIIEVRRSIKDGRYGAVTVHGGMTSMLPTKRLDDLKEAVHILNQIIEVMEDE